MLEALDANRARNQGDVAKWSKAEVCKTSIRRFESGRRLQTSLFQFCVFRPMFPGSRHVPGGG